MDTRASAKHMESIMHKFILTVGEPYIKCIADIKNTESVAAEDLKRLNEVTSSVRGPVLSTLSAVGHPAQREVLCKKIDELEAMQKNTLSSLLQRAADLLETPSAGAASDPDYVSRKHAELRGVFSLEGRESLAEREDEEAAEDAAAWDSATERGKQQLRQEKHAIVLFLRKSVKRRA